MTRTMKLIICYSNSVVSRYQLQLPSSYAVPMLDIMLDENKIPTLQAKRSIQREKVLGEADSFVKLGSNLGMLVQR